MPNPVVLSRAVKGFAEVRAAMGGLVVVVVEPLDRSNFRGRWRDVVASSGDAAGSFLTMILGGALVRALIERFPIGVGQPWEGFSLSLSLLLPNFIWTGRLTWGRYARRRYRAVSA